MGRAYNLLNVYDTSDWVGRHQGHRDGSDTYSIDVQSVTGLKSTLDQLLRDGFTFQKALFTTHGSSGVIYFAGDALTPHDLYQDFNAGHYERLFPEATTKLYFDGCNVADGEAGWWFLEAALRTFCRSAGGYAYGWTSSGFGIPSFVPWIGGHTDHAWGHTRYVFLNPASGGGAYIKRWDPEDSPTP
jgi:hypothetical protein